MHHGDKWNKNVRATPIRLVIAEETEQVLFLNATHQQHEGSPRNADVEEVPRSDRIGHGAEGVVEEDLRSNREVKPSGVGGVPQKATGNLENAGRTNRCPWSRVGGSLSFRFESCG